jgi:hypothetical protein
MARELVGVQSVERIAIPEKPALYVFEVKRAGRTPLLVVWERRDAFSGEDQPADTFEWRWTFPRASAIDALEETIPTTVLDGHVRLPVSVTPIFLEPAVK